MNDLSILSQNLPAHLLNAELDATTKALMGGGGNSGGPRISIRGGVWRMIVGGKEVAKNEDRTMNVVVVAAAPKVSRMFYMGVYKEDAVVAPSCWSADGNKPDASIKAPQSATCANCPNDVKGSGQGDSRACRFQQRIAVVLENDLGGEIYQLTLPSQSIFGEGENGKWPLQTYAKMLGSKNVPIPAVVTEMKFDTDSATPKLFFKPVRYLSASELTGVLERGKSPEAIKAITMTVAQMDNVPHSADKLDIAPAPAPVAAPAEAPEPTKTSSKKPDEAPAPKKDLSKILADWDDDTE